MKRIPIYNIILGESCGIKKMSLVEFPAVESYFIAFEKQQEEIKFAYDEQQHIVFGCALRADFPIYRYSERLGEYYVTFSAQTIKELYERFMKEGHKSVNLQHETDTDGVYLIQSFLKDTDKGINPAGFESIADGSWFCAYKIENEQVWEKVKNGEFNGFSVEGFFDLQKTEEEFSKKDEKDELDEIIDEMLK